MGIQHKQFSDLTVKLLPFIHLVPLPETQRDLVIFIGTDTEHPVTYEAAAAHFKVPIGTIRSRLSRARAAMAAYCADMGLADA
jgi:DNA-directed RNA polymerase specialized sigma24 family protein